MMMEMSNDDELELDNDSYEVVEFDQNTKEHQQLGGQVTSFLKSLGAGISSTAFNTAKWTIRKIGVYNFVYILGLGVVVVAPGRAITYIPAAYNYSREIEMASKIASAGHVAYSSYYYAKSAFDCMSSTASKTYGLLTYFKNKSDYSSETLEDSSKLEFSFELEDINMEEPKEELTEHQKLSLNQM